MNHEIILHCMKHPQLANQISDKQEFISKVNNEYEMKLIHYQEYHEKLKNQFHLITAQLVNYDSQYTAAQSFRNEYEEVIMNSKNLLELIQQDKATQENLKINIEALSSQIREQQDSLEILKQELDNDLNQILPLQHQSHEMVRSIDKRQIMETRAFSNPPQVVLQVIQLLIYILYNKKDLVWREIMRTWPHPTQLIDEWQGFDLTSIEVNKLNHIRQQMELIEQQRVLHCSQFAHKVYQYLSNLVQICSAYQIIQPKKQRFTEYSVEFEKNLADHKFQEAQHSELSKLLTLNQDKYNQLMKYLMTNSDEYQIKKAQAIAFYNLNKLLKILETKISKITFKLQNLNQFILVKNILEITQHQSSSNLYLVITELLPEYNLNEYEIFQKKLKILNQSNQEVYKIYDPHKLFQYFSTFEQYEQAHLTDELSAYINLNLSVEGLIQLYQQYTYKNNHEKARFLFKNQLKSQLNRIEIIFNENSDQLQQIEQFQFEEISQFTVDIAEPITLQTLDQLAAQVCSEIYFNLKHKNFHSLDLAHSILESNDKQWRIQMINYSCQFENLETLLDMRIQRYQQNQLWKYCLKDYPQYTDQQKEIAVQTYIRTHQILDIKHCLLYQHFDAFIKNLIYYQEQLEQFEQEYQQSCELKKQMDEYNERIVILQQLLQTKDEKIIEQSELETEMDELKRKKPKLESDEQFEENSMKEKQQKSAEMEKKIKIREIKLTLKDCCEVTRIDDPDYITYRILCLLMNMINSQATWMSIKLELSSAKKLNEITNINVGNISVDFINLYEQLKSQITIQDIQKSKSALGLLRIYKFFGQIHELYFLNIERNKIIEQWKNHELQMKSLNIEIQENCKRTEVLLKLISQNKIEISNIDRQIAKEKFIQVKLENNRDLENRIKMDLQEFPNRIQQLKFQINHLAAYCQSYELFKPISDAQLSQVIDTRTIPLFFYNSSASHSISIDFHLTQQLQLQQQTNQFQSFYLLCSLLKQLLQEWKLEFDYDGVDKDYLQLFNDKNKTIINTISMNQYLNSILQDKLFVLGFNTIFLLMQKYQISKQTVFPLLQDVFENKENMVAGIEFKSRFLNNLIKQSISLVQNDCQSQLLIEISCLVILTYGKNEVLLQQSNILDQMINLYQIDSNCDSLDQLKMQMNDIFMKEKIDEIIM